MAIDPTTVRGEACGKAIVVGEHFVVFGGTALAVPVPEARLEVTVTASPRERNRVTVVPPLADEPAVLEAARRGARRLLMDQRFALEVAAKANFPARAGLGASAAFSVAYCRALLALRGEEDEDRVAQTALELERVFHTNPSGIDSSTVAFETPCYLKTGDRFVNGVHADAQAGFIDIAPGGVFLLADSGERGDTRVALERVGRLTGNEKTRRMLEKLVGVSESISLSTASALRDGEWEYVGTMLTENHYLLQALGVSTKRLDRLCACAVESGALGAKLTGAGLGGFVLALCPPDAAVPIRTALEKEGVTTFFHVTT